VVLVTGPNAAPTGAPARVLEAMELRVMELHEWLRGRDALILHAQERLAAHGETLAPAMGGVTLQRLAEEFARAPHDDDRRRELMAACDKARRA